MRFIHSFIIVASLLFCACSKENDTVSEPDPLLNFPKIDSVQGRYLFSKEEHIESTPIGGIAHFQYLENEPAKRNGGYIPIATSGGFSGFYVPDIFDTVQYNSPTIITITTNSYIPGITFAPGKREITLENGRITRKITYGNTSTLQNDTIYYVYTPEKLLKRTDQYFKYIIITKEYFFDSNNNLQQISTVKKARDISSAPYTTQELFSGYDNSPNPLRGQTLWPDLLYRSLSKNNFTRYEFTSGTSAETKTWTYIYDSNGIVDFSH